MRRILHIQLLIVLLAAILPACGQQPLLQPDGTLAPVSVQGERLVAGGRTFELRGVNYINPTGVPAACTELHFGADAGCPWDLAPISADFDRLKALGVNTVRVFLNYYVFGGARAADPNYNVDRPLAYLDELIAEASAREIYVMPVLLAKYPQDRFGPDAYSTALDLHVRPVVEHLAGRPGVLAWDLFNEPDLGGPVDQRCWDWDNGAFEGCFPLAQERLQFVRTIHDEVKRLDPQRPTTVSLGFAKNYFKPDGADLRLADVVDFYSFHYYDDEPFDSGRYAAHWYYGQGFPQDLARGVDELRALGLAKPVVITEIGFPTGDGFRRNPGDLPRDLRAARDLLGQKQTSGMLLWPFQTDLDQLVGDLFTK